MTDVETSTAKTQDGSPMKINKETIEGMNLLAQGKRNMMCGEVPQAVNQLQEACKLLAKEYGEVSEQCGEAYLSYGSALLELARMESGVLGNALDGIDEDEEDNVSQDSVVEDPEKVSESEREEIGEKVLDAMLEVREKPKESTEKEEKDEKNQETKEKVDSEQDKTDKKDNEQQGASGVEMNGIDSGDKGEEGKKEKKEEDKKEDDTVEKKDSEESKEEEEEEEEEGTGAESEDIESQDEGTAAEGGEGTSSTKEEEKEDVSNLQLAWEVLELAKVIFSKHEEKEKRLKAADAHLRLGEVGLETEQYEQSVEDFEACLKIQKELLEPESRLIAETHYQIGLAACFSCKYDLSIEHLKSAASTIKSKMAQLQKIVDDTEGKGKEIAGFDDPITKAQKELKDLEAILPDILEKIEDTEEEKKNKDKVKALVKENVAAEMGTTKIGFGDTSVETKKEETKSVSDISHLIRKKRKQSEESTDQEETKKAKTDVITNGTSPSKDKPAEKMESESSAA